MFKCHHVTEVECLTISEILVKALLLLHYHIHIYGSRFNPQVVLVIPNEEAETSDGASDVINTPHSQPTYPLPSTPTSIRNHNPT